MLDIKDIFESLLVNERATRKLDNAAGNPEEFFNEVTNSWIEGFRIKEERFNDYLQNRKLTSMDFANRITSDIVGTYDDSWIKRLNDIVCHSKTFRYQNLEFRLGPEIFSQPIFATFFAPYLNFALGELESVFKTTFKKSEFLYKSIYGALYSEILEEALPTLIEFFHMKGKNREDFDTSFTENACHFEFIKEYPVLGRLLSEYVHRFVINTTDLLSSLIRDEPELIDRGLIRTSIDELVAISPKLGDFHAGRKVVRAVEFDGYALYYRPRSAPEYVFYNDIIKVLGLEDLLPSIEFLDKPDHCWVAEYNVTQVHNIDLATHMYRMGVLSAVLYACGSKDMHMENVVATDKGPVPIDLETILAPKFVGHSRKAFDICKEILNDSPLGTGILPVGSHLSGDSEFEVSALLGGVGAGTGILQTLVDPWGDSINFVSKESDFQPSGNIPLGSKESDILESLGSSFSGFKYGLNLIRNHENKLKYVFENFSKNNCRVLFRPTSVYDLALRTLRHPNFCRSMLARERFLMRFWGESDLSRELESSLIMSETHQMLWGDIPYFSVESDKIELRDGDTILARFSSSPLTRGLHQLKSISDYSNGATDEIYVQEVLASVGGTPRNLRSAENIPVEITTKKLEDFADLYFQRFLQTAILGDRDATWVGFSTDNANETVRLAPLGNSFYDGLAGIAISLASFYKITGDDSAKVLTRLALDSVSKDLRKLSQSASYPVGAFSGIGGLLYSLHFSCKLVGGTDFDNLLKPDIWVPELTKLADTDRFVDVSSGIAGLLLVVCSFVESGRWTLSDAKPLILNIQRRLIKLSSKAENMLGLGWQTGQGQSYLGGFSHGSSGISSALARSYSLLRNEQLLEVVSKGIAFDDNYYSDRVGMWKDMRPENRDVDVFPNYWCHGAAGILMARGLVSKYTFDQVVFEDLRFKTKEVSNHNYDAANHSLCHGTLGNALCFEVIDHDIYDETFERSIAKILSSNFIPGLDLNVNITPGLMLGHAGLLYSVCKYLDQSIPNVLWME